MVPSLSLKSLGRIILCTLTTAAPSACVKLPRRAATDGIRTAEAAHAGEVAPRVSINDASREELERLPGIGPGLAARIVEHRERHGPFRRAEHLLLVRGISERRFLQLRPHVTADPRSP